MLGHSTATAACCCTRRCNTNKAGAVRLYKVFFTNVNGCQVKAQIHHFVSCKHPLSVCIFAPALRCPSRTCRPDSAAPESECGHVSR